MERVSTVSLTMRVLASSDAASVLSTACEKLPCWLARRSCVRLDGLDATAAASASMPVATET
jgi:hypothetical protein